MKHFVLLGIEHLMTGVQMVCPKNELWQPCFQFDCESPSIVRVTCDMPFTIYWPVTQSNIESQPCEDVDVKHSHGEAEWWAKVVGPKMQDCQQRSFDMQTYARRPGECSTEGIGRYAPNEPHPFPLPVIMAMRAKFGEESDDWLAKLRWAGDHWYFLKDRMYHGVEPDGYIRT